MSENYDSDYPTLKEALVGYITGLGFRLYRHVAPTTPTYPYITFSLVSKPFRPVYGGESALQRPRFEFEVYDLYAKDVEATAKAFRSALVGWPWVEGWQVGQVQIQNERDNFENVTAPIENDAVNGVHKIEMDAIIWHTYDRVEIEEVNEDEQ